MLWLNQFLIFGPLLCIHAQYVCENRADPFTPCLPDVQAENEENNELINDQKNDDENNQNLPITEIQTIY